MLSIIVARGWNGAQEALGTEIKRDTELIWEQNLIIWLKDHENNFFSKKNSNCSKSKLTLCIKFLFVFKNGAKVPFK